MPERKTRRAQTITPFGVGAIMDLMGESLVAEDITRWSGRRRVLRAPRIATMFGVDELRRPPEDGRGNPQLPVYRFPTWLFCGSCRQMTRWRTRREEKGRAPTCEKCAAKSQLVPMRFILICENGHLDDVDWSKWAHSSPAGREARQCGHSDRLQFVNIPGVGGGLNSIAVKCTACKSQRDLSQLPTPHGPQSVGMRCRGRQPWQLPSEAVTCDRKPAAVQRGASNVYFPRVGSALDIPPYSNWQEWGGPAPRIRANDNYKLVLSNPEHPLAEQLIDMAADEESVASDEVRRLLASDLGSAGEGAFGAEAEPGEISRGEWAALTQPQASHDPRDHFISRMTEFPAGGGHRGLQGVANALGSLVSSVLIVDRLREIRVLRAFARLSTDKQVPVHLGNPTGFLPAIEVFGEGVFLRFDETAVADWESQPEVRRRARILRQRLAGSVYAGWLEDEPSPRFIMMHTFAHLVMRQMAFDAGYSSSSLRERIYASRSDSDEAPMAGILIYTAAGDSEGSLGGLARLGEAQRLMPVLTRALSSGQWCSLDPVCMESTSQGPDGLSLAACHACALASETSCVSNNVLLDRGLLVDPDFGFFADCIAAVLSASMGSDQ